MVKGLSVSRLVNVTVNLAPLAAQGRNFGTELILGDSTVIDATTRMRAYVDLESIANDFGTSAPEYLAAVLFYEQSPQPLNLYIGRWLRTASSGQNIGVLLTTAQQLMSNWTGITTGSFKVTVDGTLKTLTGLDFSGDTNLNGVAATIQADLTGATIVWTGENFQITSNTTGTMSSVTDTIPAGSGTDISAQLGMAASNAPLLVPGYAAETALAAAEVFANLSADWYCLQFASSVLPSNSDYESIANFIQAQNISRIFGITTQDPNSLLASSTTDLAYIIKQMNLTRTFMQYSSTNKYAATSFFARAASVNFAANNSTITLMYKQEPGIVPEVLTESQAEALEAKRCNVFVAYQNDTAIVQDGTMTGQAWFDEIHGLDWLQNELQTQVYNLLYQSATKIPQTDAGLNQIVNVCDFVMNEAVNNGLVAPGQWNAGGFGQLQQGQFLKTGFYIFAPPMASQSQSDREARKAPPIQIAAKLAGALQFLNIAINVNR